MRKNRKGRNRERNYKAGGAGLNKLKKAIVWEEGVEKEYKWGRNMGQRRS
jgi:hypothetical protein